MSSTLSTDYIGRPNETCLPSLRDPHEDTSGNHNKTNPVTVILERLTAGFTTTHASTHTSSIFNKNATETFIALEQEKIATPSIKVNNPELVENFLSRNPELTEHLTALASVIPSELLDSSAIEYYKDIEEHWEKLLLLINTGIEDFDQIEKTEDQLYSELIEPLPSAAQDKIILGVS